VKNTILINLLPLELTSFLLKIYPSLFGNSTGNDYLRIIRLFSRMNQVKELVQELVQKHGHNRENLLPVLQGVIEHENYLSEQSIIEIARELDIPAAEVFGTATFYSFLETRPMGKYIIRLCKTISCSMKGKNQVLLAIQDMLNIKIGQTTPDGKFTLVQTNCLGWCHEAPAMVINHEVYTNLNPEKVREILSKYIKTEIG
jgi:NADH:ubiquinone oxidoreductase subunit E